jgi:hypothetical protein
VYLYLEDNIKVDILESRCVLDTAGLAESQTFGLRKITNRSCLIGAGGGMWRSAFVRKIESECN